jgi:uncharacterized membrane protein (UPF0127 family)
MKAVKFVLMASWLFALLVGSLFPLIQSISCPIYTEASSLGYALAIQNNEIKVSISGFEILADIAISTQEKAKGLSIKDDMNEDEGMLFVYDKPSRPAFWMKDMKFPIDIIWLDVTGSVIHIEEGLKPCIPSLTCPTYSPDKEAQYVLETVAGFSKKHQLKIGTHVDFELNLPSSITTNHELVIANSMTGKQQT